MFALALLCGALACADNPGSTADARRAYEAARVKAGSSADAHVKLALWCEARGWKAERLKELALAVVLDPKHAAARGLLGQLTYREKWATPEQVSARRKSDEALAARLAEYNARRARLEEAATNDRNHRRKTASAHAQLGLWCRQNGLEAEAVAHFTTAVVLDPYRETTWKDLGYIKHNGRWMSKEQAAAVEREAHAQRAADRHWEPLLKKWYSAHSDKTRRKDALGRLDEVTDPRAVPSVERIFLGANPNDQQIAVAVLGRIDSPQATRDLAELGLKGANAEIRAAAAQRLRGREKRDYAGLLVELIHAPMKYRVQPVQGPGAAGALLVETPRFKLLRTYDAPAPFRLAGGFYGYVGYDPNGLPVVIRGLELDRMSRESPEARAADVGRFEARTAGLLAEAQLKAVAAQQRLVADVLDIETFNAQAADTNARVGELLATTLDAPSLSDDEDGWHRWWFDQLGYSYQPPTQVQVVQNAFPQSAGPTIQSCFVAGTAVRTADGSQPIESIRVGDQILCQQAETGALSLQPVLVVYHNAPSRTLRIELDTGETIVPSIYHRFWRAGRGWAQARELKAGDVVRTLGGRARVRSVIPGATEPVFNLNVASGHTFFAGRSAALVHDNTLPDPHLQPFDAEPPLVTIEAREPTR